MTTMTDDVQRRVNALQQLGMPHCDCGPPDYAICDYCRRQACETPEHIEADALFWMAHYRHMEKKKNATANPKPCTCGHITCICGVKERHAQTCKFRIAMSGSVGIECEHGYDVCPTCDPCTCPGGITGADLGGQ